jgi:hypothetical protein
MDVDFRFKSAAAAHFWPLFGQEQKVAKGKRDLPCNGKELITWLMKKTTRR